MRMIVPSASGGVTSGRSVGSRRSVGATGAGVVCVFQSSWNVAPGME